MRQTDMSFILPYADVIAAIRECLPAESVREIHHKVCRLGRSFQGVKEKTVRNAMLQLRKHPNLYGWTIPHVGQPRKYFEIHCDRDGKFHDDASARDSFQLGSKAMIQTIVTHSMNSTEMLRAASKATHLHHLIRGEYEELAEDYEILVKKVKRLQRKLKLNGN
jgi:hypothetical protein